MIGNLQDAVHVMNASTHSEQRVPDALGHHWSERFLPASWRPYARLMRLERPVGWQLLLLPGLWAVALAQVMQGGGWPDWRIMVLLLLGSIVMRGAGCVYNDIVDRDIDAKVERTRARPLPSGQVSVRQAWGFLVLLLLVGLIVLLLLPRPAQWVAVASLGLVIIYPFMKRITYWPQLFLGLAFNWAALVGWVAVRGALEAPALLLYAGGVLWTLAYDTIYAHQDRADDLMAGVKSTALKLGRHTKIWLAVFFALALGLIGLAGWLAGAFPLFVFALIFGALHAGWQVLTLDIDDARNCLVRFRANRDFGLIIFAGALAASLMNHWI